MKKYLLLTALLANMFAASAQETMYLIKGDKVVGKYAVADVDYAAFTLPEGVQDLPQSSGVVEDKTYMSASPVYLGTDKDCGHFQIQLSTKPITDENPPLELLYLQISTPLITDLKNIQIAEGTYTLGDAEAIAPFKFYPGILLTEGTQQLAAGTVVVNRPDNATTDYILVTDGALSVKMEGTQYTLSGMLKLENGNIVELAYSGPMVVINQSDEQPPVDEEPLPASALTENYTCTPLPSEAYVTNYKNMFADAPRLDYFMLSLYEDSGYANCLDIALVRGIGSDARIGTHQLAEVGDVVHERNAGRKHGVRRVFGHFGRRNVHEDDSVVVEYERPVELFHELPGPFALDADDDPVGAQKILDGGPLFQEFGVGRHVEFDVCAPFAELFADGRLDLGGGAYGHGRLGDQERVFVDCAAERAGNFEDILQVGRTVFVGRGAHGREDDVDLVDTLGQVGGESEPPGLNVAADHPVQPGLVNGDFSGEQGGDFVLVLVDAGDVRAHFGEACTRHQADVSGTYDCDIHVSKYSRFNFAEAIFSSIRCFPACSSSIF